MTELQLYKFLEDNNIEYHWDVDQFSTFIPFNCLKEFAEMLDYNFLSDGGYECVLVSDYIYFDLVEIAEYFDIDLENILKKEGE